jgi:hypothetical protein
MLYFFVGVTSSRWSVLQFFDYESHTASLVNFVLIIVADKDFDVVFDTQGLSSVVFARLQGDRSWRRLRKLERQREGIFAQLLNQALLHRCHFHLVISHRVDLLLANDQLLAELQAHRLVLFSIIYIYFFY